MKKVEKKAAYELEIEGYKCKLSEIDRPTMGIVLSILMKGDILGAGEIIVNNCWVEGDEELRKDPNSMLNMSLLKAAGELIEFKQAVLKKI